MKGMGQFFNFLAVMGIVISIIAIIIGFSILPSHKFSSLLDRATSILIQNNIKEIENASERYYIEKQNWPILNKSYTAEQIKEFTKQIKDRTGKIVELDPEGQYHNLDYISLQRYLRIPSNNSRYILQLPSGKVYYLDELSNEEMVPDVETSMSAYEEYYKAIKNWIKDNLKF